MTNLVDLDLSRFPKADIAKIESLGGKLKLLRDYPLASCRRF